MITGHSDTPEPTDASRPSGIPEPSDASGDTAVTEAAAAPVLVPLNMPADGVPEVIVTERDLARDAHLALGGAHA